MFGTSIDRRKIFSGQCRAHESLPKTMSWSPPAGAARRRSLAPRIIRNVFKKDHLSGGTGGRWRRGSRRGEGNARPEPTGPASVAEYPAMPAEALEAQTTPCALTRASRTEDRGPVRPRLGCTCVGRWRHVECCKKARGCKKARVSLFA